MNSLEELRKLRDEVQQKLKLREANYRMKIVVGMGTSGIAMGAREVMKVFLDEVAKNNLADVLVTQTGEKGLSTVEPFADVIDSDGKTVTYVNLDPEKAKKIIQDHVIKGTVVNEYVQK